MAIMDTDIKEILTRFKRLENNLARRVAYHRILDELEPHEWQDIKKRVNQRPFRKDILGAVPLEIVVQITQYLNLGDLYALRSVSRRWYNMLSSKSVCSAAFRQYTGGSLNHEFKSTFAQFSKQRLRLERGNPLDGFQINLPFVTGQEITTLDYSNGRYAWATDDDTTVVVFDLHSHKTQRFCTEHREKLQKIRLSESTVAAITLRGYCHAWNLQTEEVQTVRLPNTNIRLFVLSGFRIAAYLKQPNLNGREDGGFVVHSNLQSRTTHTIEHVQNLALISLDPSPRHLTMILLEKQGGGLLKDIMTKCPHLRIVKYELDDDEEASIVRTHTAELSLPDGFSVRIQYAWQDNCRNRVGILLAESIEHLTTQRFLPITYHPQTDTYCVHTLLPHQIYLPLHVSVADVGKNILYYISYDVHEREIGISISNPYADPPLHASRSMDLRLPSDPSDRVPVRSYTRPTLAGDSHFVSMINEVGARVWSFDEADLSRDVTMS